MSVNEDSRIQIKEHEMKTYLSTVISCVIMLSNVALIFADYDTYSADYLIKGYQYLSPVPNSEYNSPQTRYVLMRFQNVSPYDIENLSTCVEVTGDSSGVHPGLTTIASDDLTILFQMDTDFTANEIVTISLNPIPAPGSGTVEPFEYQFAISTRMPGAVPTLIPLSATAEMMEPEETPVTGSSEPIQAEYITSTDGPMIMPNGVAIPSNFPFINITINDNPDEGYIFVDNRSAGNNSFNIIFDNNGWPVWYQQTNNDDTRNMQVQCNGLLTLFSDSATDKYIGLDSTYTQVAEYTAVNGYATDEHELQILDDGTYFLIAIRSNVVDMSQYFVGGRTNANVSETIVQGFTPLGELIFQWRGWDNYDILDLVSASPTAGSISFPHINAVGIDADSNLLISCRHLSEVTKVDRSTGQMVWRLGGAHNQFTFINDSLNGFTTQHAIRNTGPNRYTLFDNGNLHPTPISRGIEYELDITDPNAKTATLVWEHRETPDVFSTYMSNTQRLPNGNTLINWAVASLPKLTEVRPDGTKAFEMNWVNNYETYRTWRFPWSGVAAVPSLTAELQEDNITLVYNKFGDPNVAYYNIYGGTSPEPNERIASPTTTIYEFTDFESGQLYYFRVTAVDSDGNESGFSNEASIVANIYGPGQNMIQNGDFSNGTDSWIWLLSSGANANWTIEDGVSHVDVITPTTLLQNVQVKQTNKPLLQGKTYVFEFDAWAAEERQFEAKIVKNASPFTNYSGIGISNLTTTPQHFKYSFVMQQASYSDCRVVLNSGKYLPDVYFDNVSLFMAADSDINLDAKVNLLDFAILSEEWLSTIDLTADIDDSGTVDMADLLIFVNDWVKI